MKHIAMKHVDRMHARELKKGSAELLILSLIEVRARHGYEIGKLIEQRSSGAITFNAAALYPAALPPGEARVDPGPLG